MSPDEFLHFEMWEREYGYYLGSRVVVTSPQAQALVDAFREFSQRLRIEGGEGL